MNKIIYTIGDITHPRPGYECDYIINTVNCVGVMGKGVALAFKQAYFWIMPEYQLRCRTHMLNPGDTYVDQESLRHHNDPNIIHAATKGDWRNPSRKAWIIDVLINLSQDVTCLPIKSLALPALGCGNGGLSWDVIGPITARFLESLDIKVVIYLSPGMKHYHIPVQCALEDIS